MVTEKISTKTMRKSISQQNNYFFKACKKRKNKVLGEWVAPIRNHFWHCVKNCGGDLEKLKVRMKYAVVAYFIFKLQ